MHLLRSARVVEEPAHPAHGGDLAAARRRFPDAPRPWLDLSTGLNPVPYPVGPIPPETWARLPDADALAALEAIAALAYRASAGAVVAASGTQALIQLLPRLIPARRVAILGFGYGEHPAVWRSAGAAVTVVDDVADLSGAEVAVVVNPNNPDGRCVDPADLGRLAAVLARRGGLLVVDEAFADVMEPGLSLVPRLPPEGALVLRSFGKVFGLAGLRLGFAVAPPGLAARLRSGLGPWPVSGPALALGNRALADADWLRGAVARLRTDAARLDAVLAAARLTSRGGTPLFRLVETPHASEVFERLGRAGILLRAFAERPTWLRVGLPADAEALDRLRVALRP